MAKKETVPFSKIKVGGFFRMKGEKWLLQRGKTDVGAFGQAVTGRDVGKPVWFGYYDDHDPNTQVIPVNAKIVEEN